MLKLVYSTYPDKRELRGNVPYSTYPHSISITTSILFRNPVCSLPCGGGTYPSIAGRLCFQSRNVSGLMQSDTFLHPKYSFVYICLDNSCRPATTLCPTLLHVTLMRTPQTTPPCAQYRVTSSVYSSVFSRSTASIRSKFFRKRRSVIQGEPGLTLGTHLLPDAQIVGCRH